MANVRMTTKVQFMPEIAERARTPVHSAVKPVVGRDGVDADRHRPQHDERDAEQPPVDAAEPLTAAAAEAEAREVVEELHRLGSEAMHLLQPLGEKAQRLAEGGHVDDEA